MAYHKKSDFRLRYLLRYCNIFRVIEYKDQLKLFVGLVNQGLRTDSLSQYDNVQLYSRNRQNWIVWGGLNYLLFLSWDTS